MKKTSVFGMLCIGVSVFSFAQQQQDSTKVQQLNEVVVSDSRFELKRENSGKTVIQISRQEIENNQGRTLSELINTKSGIEINGSRSAEGSNQTSFVRGGDNRQVLVIIDGVQVNDPSLLSNEFDLRLLDLNAIETIEIMKGAASTLYGNAAATAVINITTKKASKEKISANALTVVGTNQSQNDSRYNGSSFTNQLSVNGTVNKLNYVASLGSKNVDGLSSAITENPESDSYSRHNANFKLGYQVLDNFEITGFASLDKIDTEIDGFPAPNYVLTDTEDKYISQQKRIGISPKFKYNNGSFQVNSAYTKIDRQNISDYSATYNADSYIVDAFNKYVFNKSLHTIAGLNYGKFKSLFNTNKNYATTDPYLNIVYVFDFGLSMNSGARLNNHSEYGSHFVYSINPSYHIKVNEGYAKIFSSYATSFIAPNLSQLFGEFGANPNLKPEENKSFEGGLEFSNNRGFRISGLYFNREETNKIIYTSAYENATSVFEFQGIEIEAQITPIKKLNLTANYTFTETKNGISLRVPKQKINGNIGYAISEKTFASLNYQFVGSRMDTNYNTYLEEKMKPYSLVDLYFSQKLKSESVKLFINLTNIFNENYIEVIGYTTKGRNVSLGLNINL